MNRLPEKAAYLSAADSTPKPLSVNIGVGRVYSECEACGDKLDMDSLHVDLPFGCGEVYDSERQSFFFDLCPLCASLLLQRLAGTMARHEALSNELRRTCLAICTDLNGVRHTYRETEEVGASGRSET